MLIKDVPPPRTNGSIPEGAGVSVGLRGTGVTVGVCVDVEVAVGVAVAVGVSVGVDVAVELGVSVGALVGVDDGEGMGDGVSVTVGETEWVAVIAVVGVSVGATVPVAEVGPVSVVSSTSRYAGPPMMQPRCSSAQRAPGSVRLYCAPWASRTCSAPV